jgi:hypothetical protein
LDKGQITNICRHKADIAFNGLSDDKLDDATFSNKLEKFFSLENMIKKFSLIVKISKIINK